MNYENWKQGWRISGKGERLGQAFVNEFMVGDSPEIRKIYYVTDYWEADALITKWLIDTQHYPNVPKD